MPASEYATPRRGDKGFGIWSPTVTPLDDALEPDIDRLVTHVRRQLAAGCHGVTLFGTTGEATSFSVAERMRTLEAVIAADIPASRLMVGTGCSAFTDTVTLTAQAVRQGCGGVLMLPPFYYKGVSDDGVFASYAEVFERVGENDLEVYLYHFPRLSGVPIGHDLVERLVQRYPDTVRGIKDSTSDEPSTLAYIERFPQLAVFPGTEALLLPGLKKGGAGCISATANVNARGIRALYDAWVEGSGTIDELHESVVAVRQTLDSGPLIPGLKAVLAYADEDTRWRRIRPPLTPFSAADEAMLLKALAGIGFDARREIAGAVPPEYAERSA